MMDAILRCPKCHAAMTPSRRDGVVFEQCVSCRGVFLGEPVLARLIESASAAPPAVPPAAPPANSHSKQLYEGRHRRY